MFVDTHFHLSKKDYDNLSEVIINANNNNVKKLIVSACEKENMIECLDYMEEYSSLYYTFGFHPDCVDEIDDKDIIWLEKVIKSHPKIIGIGEIGLDYHYKKEARGKQLELFHKQLKLAERLDLPVVIHSRDATEDTINALKQYSLRGVIHCFSGSLETADIYIKMGYLLGIGGVATFSNSHLLDVVKQIPLEYIVLETDSPYLAPVPVRGTKNEPKNIPYIANAIASAKGELEDTVKNITTSNAMRLFDLTK